MLYIANLKDYDEDFFVSSLAEFNVNVKQHIEKIRHEKSRNQSILAWHIFYTALKSDYGKTAVEIKFSQSGKPYLLGEDIFFNLSHSENLVACIISSYEVGVDVQKITDNNEKVINRFFTAEEKCAIEESEDKNLSFTRIWTLKESYLKMTGQGISGELNKIDFSKNLMSNHFKLAQNEFQTFSFGEYIISVCSKKADFELTNF